MRSQYRSSASLTASVLRMFGNGSFVGSEGRVMLTCTPELLSVLASYLHGTARKRMENT